jgi:hypothetical protein
VPPAQQRIIFCGAELDDHTPLNQLPVPVVDGTVVHLALRKLNVASSSSPSPPPPFGIAPNYAPPVR